jgi:phytoene dehydrogenase-like protein
MLMDGTPNGIPARWPYMNTINLLKDIFEDRRVIMFLTRIALAAGVWPDESSPLGMSLRVAIGPGLGLGAAGIMKGGTHQIIHGAQRVLFEVGGETFCNCEVDEIVIENGKAKGIKLVDGSFIEAKKMVITNIEPRQMLHRQLRNFPVSPKIIRDMDNVPADYATLFWGDVAMHERPKYIAEEFCPELAKVGGFLIMGDDDLSYFEKEYRFSNQHIRPGKWPAKMHFWENPKSLVDPEQAPPGKHISLVEEYGPPASAMTEQEWVQVRRELPFKLLENWRRYAPNMTEDNIIGIEVDTPGDFVHRNKNLVNGGWTSGVPYHSAYAGRYRPIPELSHYKVPGIDNLYLAGSSHMPGGGGSTADSPYSMYKVIAKDFGLRKFWEEVGRPY